MAEAKDDATSPLVGAIDQGTSSSRFLIFSGRTGNLIASHQIQVNQSCPKDGWVEMDGVELLTSVQLCIEAACALLPQHGMSPSQIKTVGIANQRETSLMWRRSTGVCLHPAIVWLDARTAHLAERLTAETPTRSRDHWRDVCGLPVHPYFSALKIRWMIDNVPAVADAIRDDDCMAGTVDAWLVWRLTGGAVFATDVTNASRTMLMNLRTADWDDDMCRFFGIPKAILPQIRSSAERFGQIEAGVLKGVPISGVLGDQQAALLGNMCLEVGEAKNTYGTGTFMLFNTGTGAPCISHHGLLTTVAYRLGADQPVCYALEGAGSIGGTGVQWLRDGLGVIKAALLGNMCLEVGEAKNTYGTGTFMLFNTGTGAPCISHHGLLTTIAYRLSADQPVCYALEGAGSIGGTGVQWLRDGLSVTKAALLGNMCLEVGEAKNTYGTGTFMLFNTGTGAPCISHHGLLTTAAYRLGADQPVCYALEGAGSIGGTGVQWLRDGLGAIKSSAEVEDLAKTETDCGGVYFVSAFSGLYTPYWDPSARGTICGLTLQSTKGHLARAALEAVCFQTVEMTEAIEKDSRQKMKQLKVDGGMTQNATLMRMQASLLGVEVCRPRFAEMTAWGAAAAAGLAEGVWTLEWLRRRHVDAELFQPDASADNAARLNKWKQAVANARGWAPVVH